MNIPHKPCVPDDWSSQFFGPMFVEIFDALGKFDSTEQDARMLIELLGISPNSKILDIPCGFGRFSHLLSKYGFNITGLDASSHLLKIGHKKYPGPTYIQGDMRFPPDGPFDAVLNLWTSFGYFAHPSEDRKALIAWHRVLRPNGVLIMEITDLERAMAENPGTEFGITYKSRRINDVLEEAWIDWSLPKATIRYSIRDQSFVGETRIYSQNQLVDLLTDVGFSSVTFYGGFDGRPKRATDRLVIKAIK